MKYSFIYFTNKNPHDVYIEDRGGRFNRYAVWHGDSIVADCVKKQLAIDIANGVVDDIKAGVYKEEDF